MNKKAFLSLLALSSSLFAFDYNLEPKQINENTWCFFGNLDVPNKKNGGNMSNSCYINAGSSYVLIDSGPTYNYAKQAYETMSKIKKLPVSTVINTHEHDDHWLGNSYYKKNFNPIIYGPKAINKNHDESTETRMFVVLSADAIKNTKIVKVDKEIDKETKIKIDNINLTLVPMNMKAHTHDDIFVYDETNKTMFSGDLVMNGRLTSNRHGSVIGQLKALEEISKYDFENLVPGHGFDTSQNAADESTRYFSLLKQKVMDAVEDDIGANEVTKQVKLEEFKDKAMYKEVNSRNVFDAYGELEFYEEE